jgi:hypothetical protein
MSGKAIENPFVDLPFPPGIAIPCAFCMAIYPIPRNVKRLQLKRLA